MTESVPLPPLSPQQQQLATPLKIPTPPKELTQTHEKSGKHFRLVASIEQDNHGHFCESFPPYLEKYEITDRQYRKAMRDFSEVQDSLKAMTRPVLVVLFLGGLSCCGAGFMFVCCFCICCWPFSLFLLFVGLLFEFLHHILVSLMLRRAAAFNNHFFERHNLFFSVYTIKSSGAMFKYDSLDPTNQLGIVYVLRLWEMGEAGSLSSPLDEGRFEDCTDDDNVDELTLYKGIAVPIPTDTPDFPTRIIYMTPFVYVEMMTNKKTKERLIAKYSHIVTKSDREPVFIGKDGRIPLSNSSLAKLIATQSGSELSSSTKVQLLQEDAELINSARNAENNHQNYIRVKSQNF